MILHVIPTGGKLLNALQLQEISTADNPTAALKKVVSGVTETPVTTMIDSISPLPQDVSAHLSLNTQDGSGKLIFETFRPGALHIVSKAEPEDVSGRLFWSISSENNIVILARPVHAKHNKPKYRIMHCFVYSK